MATKRKYRNRTEQNFLTSLIGSNGNDGIDGIDGLSVPIGGTTGQALVKNSDTDYDYSWVNLAANGNSGQDGTDGIDGKGWTGGSYNSTNGKVTFASTDGIGFETGDLRGTNGTNGTNGVSGSSNPKVFETDFSFAYINGATVDSNGMVFNVSHSPEINIGNITLSMPANNRQGSFRHIFLKFNLVNFKSFKTTIKTNIPNLNANGFFSGFNFSNNGFLHNMVVQGFGFCVVDTFVLPSFTSNIYAFTSDNTTGNAVSLVNKTFVDTGVAFPLDNWITFEIKKIGTNFEFYINDNLVATIATTRITFITYLTIYFNNNLTTTQTFSTKYLRLEVE